MSERVELLVGKVGRAHGIRGDLTIDVRTDEPERRFAPGTPFSTRHGTLTVSSLRWHSSRLLVRFDGVSDRTAAERLRGTELHVELDPDESPDDPEEFYDHQLVGLRVETGSGDQIGELTEVLHLPAQDVLVVRRVSSEVDSEVSGMSAATATEVMIPFVTEFVPTVDLAGRRVVVTDAAGLLDDSDGAGAGTDAAEESS